MPASLCSTAAVRGGGEGLGAGEHAGAEDRGKGEWYDRIKPCTRKWVVWSSGAPVQEEEGTKGGDRGLSGPPIRFSLADLGGRVAGARATAQGH
jgi:hypothetical protein